MGTHFTKNSIVECLENRFIINKKGDLKNNKKTSFGMSNA